MKKTVFTLFVVFLFTGMVHADNVTLCYHQFDYSLKNLYSVVPEVFEWQVRYLRDNNIDIISLDDMVKAYTQTKKIGTNVLVTIDDGWTNNWSVIPFLQRENVPFTLFYIADGIDSSNAYFSEKDIEKLKAIPEMSFGSHSVTHIPLVRKNQSVLQWEIADSREILEKMFGRKVETFAYPYGAFDAKAQKFAAKTYTLCFGIDDGPNTIKQNRSNIRRDVIYRTTSFGEFIDLIDDIRGKRADKGYHVVNLGVGRETIRYFNYVKVRLYEFPSAQSKKTVLIVPGTVIGPAWIYKTVENLVGSGIQACVMVPRNNNVPYWRPDREMSLVTNWNLDVFQDDMKSTLDYLAKQNRDVAVITWNDGYDILLSTLLKYPSAAAHIRGIFGVNPSIREDSSVKDIFGNRIADIDRRMAAGDFTKESLHFFLKVKTLADLAILEPDRPSPYAWDMGYGFRSNFELLKAFIDDQADPDLSLDGLNIYYTMKEFQRAFFKPVPVFGMVNPMSLERDINELWSRNYEWKDKGVTGKDNLKIPVYYLYSYRHRDTVLRLTNAFTNMPLAGSAYLDGLSTVGLLLSSGNSELTVNQLKKWLQ